MLSYLLDFWSCLSLESKENLMINIGLRAAWYLYGTTAFELFNNYLQCKAEFGKSKIFLSKRFECHDMKFISNYDRILNIRMILTPSVITHYISICWLNLHLKGIRATSNDWDEEWLPRVGPWLDTSLSYHISILIYQLSSAYKWNIEIEKWPVPDIK